MKTATLVEVKKTCLDQCNINHMQYNPVTDRMEKCLCDNAKKFHIRSNIVRSLIPEKYRELKLSDFNDSIQTTIALDEIDQFVTNYNLDNPRGFYFHGSTGTGKTMLASYLAIRLIEENKTNSIRYIKFRRDFLEEIKSTYAEGFDAKYTEKEILSLNQKVDVLVIDEFGIGKTDSDWASSLIYDLIDYRYENELTTIFTSNYPIEFFKNYSQGRIYSRIVEMTTRLEFSGIDYRIKSARAV